MESWPRAVAGVAVVLLVGVAVAYGVGVFDAGGDEGTTVTVRDEDGSRLATIRVRVADTQVERYTGLSETESLEAGEGMLFVHETENTYAYVMRDMAFPLDIVFVAADGTITRIHHAPLPPEGTPNGELTRYEGRGKYVLEVPYGYTNRTGISTGDRVVVPPKYRS
ncbi:MAG: DUF192 domain-containing protein [Haloferacaceae archaeon]